MDLLLRWVTLRFFETNTTVNLKCLEFLHALFKMLVDDGNYRMSDYEANAFLPYLVNKVGHIKYTALGFIGAVPSLIEGTTGFHRGDYWV